MNIKQLIAAGMLVAAPVAALAQQAPARAAALNPDASVPAPAYNSAFEQYPSAATGEAEVTPDKAWRSANAQVAGDEAAPGDHSKMNHGTMDHSKMDHGTMDHSKMDQGKTDHSKMDHSKHNKHEGKE